MGKSNLSRFVISVLFLCSGGCGSESSSQGPDDSNNETDSDVLIYCYQPESDTETKQIYRINADGTGNTRMTNAPIGLNHPDWSPDAERLALVGYVNQNTWSIHLVDTTGENLTRLTFEEGVWDTEPCWSPDGDSIAFTRILPSQNYRNEIWVMASDGTNQHWIGLEGFAPKWSVDGERFVYCTNTGGNYDVYTCNANGSDVRQLTSDSTNEMSPTWSPDGSLIAYMSDSDGDFDICVMDTSGGFILRLTDNSIPEYTPRWSPDGHRLAFEKSSTGDDHWEIFIINADGTGLRQLTSTPEGYTAICPVWRPDN